MTVGVPMVPGYRTEISASYAVQPTDRQVVITTLSLALAITLPDPTTVGYTDGLLIKDESGLLTVILAATVSVAGGATIDGLATLVLSAAFGKVTLYSNGKAWFTR